MANDPKFLFQYCQKLIVLSDALDSVLLAKRNGEADYDQTYTFIGGKMETSDAGFLEGAKREKDEEIGPKAKINIYSIETTNVLFRKKDGNSLILPHFACRYIGGEIKLNDEYSDYKWVPITELNEFEPKISNIPELVHWALRTLTKAASEDLVEI